MKIAYLHYLYGEQTGLHHVRQFVQAARGLGYKIETYAMHPENAERGAGERVSARLRARRVLKRYLRRYLHEPKKLLMTVPYSLREARLLKSSPTDILLVRSSALNFSCIPVARNLGLPLVIELNSAPEEARLYLDQYWHIPWLTGWLEGWKLSRSDGIVVVSSWLKNHLVENYGLEAEKISVVPNGADMQVFRPDLDSDPDVPEAFQTAPVVGFVGSFLKWHGSDLLGRMAAEVAAVRPTVRFLFVGDGPGSGIVQRMTAPLGGRVHFTGMVPHDRVPGLVTCFDIAVMPDSNPYGSPLKVIEWMAAGKAVVAPRYGPLEDLINDGIEGLLIPPRDSEALTRAVLRLVDDTKLRQSLGQAAAERVRSSLTWEHNARRVIAACEKALARHRSSPGGRT